MEKSAQMTQEEIRRAGLQVFAQTLGPMGTVRFLQQFENGSGNYTKERHQWQDHLNVRSMVQQAGLGGG